MATSGDLLSARAATRWIAASLCASLAVPATASAWTSATVRTASTELRIVETRGDQVLAHVHLDATLRVDGGWLEAFELDGLGPSFVLDPEGIVLIDAAGERTPGTVRALDQGRVVLSFSRRSAPRRGDYRLAVDGVVSLPQTTDGDETHLSFVFPSWRYGLDDVVVSIDAPAGAHAITDESVDDMGLVRLGSTARGDRTVLTWHRVHLARTREWQIDLGVPRAALGLTAGSHWAPTATLVEDEPESSTPRASVAPIAPTSPRPVDRRVPLALAAIVGLGVIGKRHAMRRAARQAGLEPLALVRPQATFTPGLVAASAMVARVFVDHLALDLLAATIVLLAAWHRQPARGGVVQLGRFRHVSSTAIRQARRARWLELVHPAAWFDMGALGALTLALLVGLGGWLDAHEQLDASALVALATTTATLFVGSRRTLPLGGEAELDLLSRILERLTLPLDGPPLSFALLAHTDAETDAVQSARLRIGLAEEPSGLLRLDVSARDGASAEGALRLLVVVRDGSIAHRRIAASPLYASIAPLREGRRLAYVVPLDTSRELGRRLTRLAEPLVDGLEAPSELEAEAA